MQIRLMARRARHRHARMRDVDHRRRHHLVAKRKPRPLRKHAATGGDERSAVVDRPPGLVAQ